MAIDGSKENRPIERPLKERVRVKAFDEEARVFESKSRRQGKEINSKHVKDVLYAFLEQQLATASMFRSEKYGASFLYAVVDAASIAKILYREYAGALPPLEAQVSDTHPKRDFIFGSYIFPHVDGSGVLFTYFQHPLHQVMQELPQAFADLQNGKEPKRHEIFLISSPARDIGHITEGFIDSMKKKGAFAACADVYAEFVEAVNHEEGVADIKLHGFSMGASFALKTAENLLASKKVTQSRKDANTSGIPFLEVRLDTPVAQTPFSKFRRKWQSRAGLLIDSAVTILFSRFVRLVTLPSSFKHDIAPILEKKGIVEDMSPEQARLKNEAAKAIRLDIYKGAPVPIGMRTTEIIGLLDILTFPATETLGGLVRALVEKMQENPPESGLPEKTAPLSKQGSDREKHGIRSGHSFDNFPNSVIEDMYTIDRILAALEKG